jgi:hypothetical protein
MSTTIEENNTNEWILTRSFGLYIALSSKMSQTKRLVFTAVEATTFVTNATSVRYKYAKHEYNYK